MKKNYGFVTARKLTFVTSLLRRYGTMLPALVDVQPLRRQRPGPFWPIRWLVSFLQLHGAASLGESVSQHHPFFTQCNRPVVQSTKSKPYDSKT